jgi:DNA-binding GntR family transcriptional regulator
MNRPYMTKAQVAAETIRDWIKHGRMAPGSRIEVHRVSEDLAMSPTPIREALRLLEAEGLVVSIPHRGTHVASFSPRHAEALYDLRAQLEEYATARAIPRMQDEDLRELSELVDEHAQAVREGLPHEIEQATRNWHMLIYRFASEGTPLLDFISRLWDGYPWTTTWTWSLPGRDQRAVDFHRQITEAALARDAGTAGALMREHILAGGAMVVSYLASAGISDPEQEHSGEGGDGQRPAEARSRPSQPSVITRGQRSPD